MSSEESPNRAGRSRLRSSRRHGLRAANAGAADCVLDANHSSRSHRRPACAPGFIRPSLEPVAGPDPLDGPARSHRRGFDRHRTTGDSAAPGRFCDARNGRRPKFWKINHFLSGQDDPIGSHGKIGIVALVRIGKWRILYVVRARRLCAQSPSKARG
jgi:hypothetical protein